MPLHRLFVVAILFFSVAAAAPPDPEATYVIYLHGRIVEGTDPRPVHPQFGKYDYPGIVEALAARDAIVVTEQRPVDTDMSAYATRVIGQIEVLLHGGVAPKRIVVVGFSKGGGIVLQVADRFDHHGVRYVVMAACGDGLASVPDLRLSGDVLSIFERSDDYAGSCAPLNAREERAGTFDEIELSTGLAHGAFYRPRADWMEPLLDWIHGPASPTATRPSVDPR